MKKVLALFIFFILLLSGCGSGSETGVLDITSQCNWNNGGKMAFDDNSLYFIGTFDSDDDNCCIYSTSYTGTNKKKLYEADDVWKIMILDGTLFLFKDKSVETMNADGSNISTLLQSSHSISALYATHSTIYYLTYNDDYESELHSCERSGENDTLLTEDDVNEFIYTGDSIIYSTDNSIYSMDLKGNKTEICGMAGKSLSFNNKTVYFINDYLLYSVPSDGSQRPSALTTTETRVGEYSIKGDLVYFTDMLTNDQLIDVAKSWGYDEYFGTIGLKGYGLVWFFKTDGHEIQFADAAAAKLYLYPDGAYKKISPLIDSFEYVKLSEE